MTALATWAAMHALQARTNAALAIADTSQVRFVRVPVIQFQASNGWYARFKLDMTKTLEKLRSPQIQLKKYQLPAQTSTT